MGSELGFVTFMVNAVALFSNTFTGQLNFSVPATTINLADPTLLRLN